MLRWKTLECCGAELLLSVLVLFLIHNPEMEMKLSEAIRRQERQDLRFQIFLSVALFAMGLALSGFAFVKIKAHDMRMAQLTPQSTPPNDQAPNNQTRGSNAPAESKPGGTRPTTPAPEPARPDADAQKVGSPTALPPAPAEKTAAPIEAK
jgi:hypothetical protein